MRVLRMVCFTPTVILFSSLVWPTEGLKCLSCSDVSQPRLCHLIDDCDDGETCVVERYRMENGEIRYKTDCVSKNECDNTGDNLLHNSRVLCKECCSSDLCNVNGCGAPAYPLNYGPVCYSCEDELSPDTCKRIKLCSPNEICAMEERREFMQSTYKTQCLRSHVCNAIYGGPNIIGRRKRASMYDISTERTSCNYCCNGQLCNTGCSATHPPSTARMTPVSATMQVNRTITPSTHVHSSATHMTTTTPTTTTTTYASTIDTFSFSAKTNSSVYTGRAPFQHVFSNEGNSYDSNSGIFVCPREGLYFFTWTIQVVKEQVKTGLFVNGIIQKELVTIPAGGNNESNTAITILGLVPGDTVHIDVIQGKMLPDVCSFSGWQIKVTDVLVYTEYNKNISKYYILRESDTGFNRNTTIFTVPKSGTYLFYVSTNRGQNCDTALDDAFFYSGGDGTAGAFIKTMNSGQTVNFNVYCTFNIIILRLGTTEWFSASSIGTRSEDTKILPFDRKVFSYYPSNVFDPSNGVYTCGQSGTYVLAWTIENNKYHQSVASSLLVNGRTLMEGYTTSSLYGSSNNVVIVYLNHGDKVSIRTHGFVAGGYTMITGFRLS